MARRDAKNCHKEPRDNVTELGTTVWFTFAVCDTEQHEGIPTYTERECVYVYVVLTYALSCLLKSSRSKWWESLSHGVYPLLIVFKWLSLKLLITFDTLAQTNNFFLISLLTRR